MKRVLLLVAAGIALVGAPSASAHAFLVRSIPAAGSTIRSAPSELVLVFDEPIADARARVTRANASAVPTGRARVPKGRPKEMVVPLDTKLARGGYVVRWSEVDQDDGHLVSGAFSFGIGVKPPTVEPGGGSGFRASDSIARWVLLAGLLVAGGVVVFRRFVWRRPERRFLVAAAGALALAVAGCALLLALQPGTLTTRFDRLTLAGGIVAALGAVLFVAALRLPTLVVAADVAALALLALPTLAGHASAPGPSHRLSVPSDLVHVLGASIWIGGVFSLVALVPRARRSDAVRRFAPIALAAVAALGVTGVLRAVGELNAVSQLWATSYGRAILVKTAIFAVILALAAAAHGRPSRRGLAIESVLMVGLLAAVAVLVGLRPGRDVAPAAAAAAPPPPAAVTAGEAGPYAVGVALTPQGSSIRARATVLGIQGPTSGLRVTISMSGASAPARSCGVGCYWAVLAAPRPASLRVRIVHSATVSRALLRAPQLWPAPAATPIVQRASRAFRSLRSLTFRSHLASTPTIATTTIWKMQTPNRLAGEERGTGVGTVLIGGRRWDRDSATAPWVESPQVPIRQPSLPWTGTVRDAHVLGAGTVRGHPVWLVSFDDPATPAWFTIAVDRQTGRTYSMDMIAAAHFMHEDYRGFNAPLAIKPPR
jgi:copper transport protein